MTSLPTPPRPLQGPHWTAGTGEGRSGFAILSERFGSSISLSEAELTLLQDLTSDTRYHPPNRNFWSPGTPPPPPRILVSGWACRYRFLTKARRQIVSLLVPGDFTSTVLQPRPPSSCAVAALTEVETVSAKPLADAAVSTDPVYPTLALAAQMAAYHQEMLLYEQITRLGQQSATERFAHLMMELWERLARVGLADGDSFALPLTQDVLADTLGLSTVHLNRTVQQLRRSDLIRMEGGTVTLLKRDKLRELSGWVSPQEATGVLQ